MRTKAVTLTGTPQLLIKGGHGSANHPEEVFFQNLSGADAYLGGELTATSTDGIRIADGELFVFTTVGKQQLWASGAGDARVGSSRPQPADFPAGF